MPKRPEQSELFPRRRMTAQERKAYIRARLEGLAFRQGARQGRRRLDAERRKRGARKPAASQVTLDDYLGGEEVRDA